MTNRFRLLAGCVVFAAHALVVEAETPRWDPAFPTADPETVGLPAAALELLAERVQTLVDDRAIVGGELLVIKDRRTVLRRAFGWKDREAERPLEVGAIYCVRSMTKPVVGAAIQILIDEGRLRLDTPVREILPFFAGPRTGKITVEHLLTHTAGFPFTTIGKPLGEYADLKAVAAEAAAAGIDVEPGTRFEYSDAGSDALGAIVAAITGAPAERFIEQRVLGPLGMRDTIPLLGDDAAVRARVPSAYSGGTGSWSAHWRPSDPPIFPLFLTSQSLYSTTTDYARFLALWMDGGRFLDRRLLSEEAVARALAPDQPMSDHPAGFEGLDAYYGQQWLVYARKDDDGRPRRVVFGHSGSDGTHAWVWPDEDLMVLFFTQSRGTLAGVGLERTLQTLLVERKLDDPSLATRVPSAAELKQVAGLYWDEDVAHAYYVVSPQGEGLTVDRPGRMRLVLRADAMPGRYVHEANARVWIEFVRAENGAVKAMRTFFGRRVEHDPRHVPEDGLPSVEEVVARVEKAHGVARLPELGVVQLSGTVAIEARGVEGSIVTLFDPARTRTEIRFGSQEQRIVVDGRRAWATSVAAGVEELDGERREQALLDRVPVRFGDWREHYEHVEVLKRVQLGDDVVLLVRVVPREGPGSTMFVHETSGRVPLVEGLAQLPGVGLVGVRTRYQDFRDVGGMLLPFRAVAEFASPLIGRVVTTWTEAETGVETPDEVFAPSEP